MATTGCSPGLFGVPQPPAVGGQVVLTEHVTPSALVAVTAVGPENATLLQVIGATARPLEYLDVASAGGTQAFVASSSPAPAVVRIPAKPVPPARGATSYQEAVYHQAQMHWDGQYAAAQREVASRTAAARTPGSGVSWPRSARDPGAGQPGRRVRSGRKRSRPGGPGRGAVRRPRRPDGRRAASTKFRPGCQLTGADVIVLTPFLPSAAAAAAAQEKLIAAGAAARPSWGRRPPRPSSSSWSATALAGGRCPSRCPARRCSAMTARFCAGRRRGADPTAPLLRQPGAIAVINGYASAPGDARHNQQLSENRAAAVAAFFEAHGISAAALLVVGHGATSFVAPGASPDNRRVVVVVEEPA